MHRSGRIKQSALDLVDLYRLDLRNGGICVSVWTDVPAVLQRFTRFTSRLDGRTQTVCERAPI